MDRRVIGPELVTQGARRAKPRQIVNRADIAAVVWFRNASSPFAQFVDENRIVRLRLPQFYPKRQARRIAAMLDVSFKD